MANQQTTKGKDEAEVDGKAGGALAGGVAGAAIGAMVGGPVGAGIGAVVGAAGGGLSGAAMDYDETEPTFRREWEASSHAKSTTWDQAAPASRYGWESYEAPENQGKSWTEVEGRLKSGWKGKGKYEDYAPAIKTAWEHRAQNHIDTGREAVVPVVQEELKVGKRQVETGGVRVETRVTEKPVSAQVHLHEEKVKVERRPVDRAVTAGDNAFREGTLELRETAEEAVVAKHARVVEEVVVRKEGRDHTETVNDTVRRRDVEIKQVDSPVKVVGKAYETYATGFEKDFQTRHANTGYTFDQFSPAYRHGYNLAGDERYQGDWATVEPEARRHWEKANKGTWEEFKDATHHAWESVRGKG